MRRSPPAAGELPRKRHLLPDVWLADASGKARPVSAYRGARTAVVVAAGAHAERFVRELAALAADFRGEDVAVIVIAPGATPPAAPGVVLLADVDAAAHARLAGSSDGGGPAWGAYVTDEFGEIHALFRELSGDEIPSATSLLEWAEFVNLRCEECFPPEWPEPEP